MYRHAHDHVPKNALFASAFIRAASCFASSDTSGKSCGFKSGDAGTEDGGVEEAGEEMPDSEEVLMAVGEQNRNGSGAIAARRPPRTKYVDGAPTTRICEQCSPSALGLDNYAHHDAKYDAGETFRFLKCCVGFIYQTPLHFHVNVKQGQKMVYISAQDGNHRR